MGKLAKVQKCEASEELKRIPGLVKTVWKNYNALIKAGLIKPIDRYVIIKAEEEEEEEEGELKSKYGIVPPKPHKKKERKND